MTAASTAAPVHATAAGPASSTASRAAVACPVVVAEAAVTTADGAPAFRPDPARYARLGDELAALRGVNAVEARPGYWWAGNANVNFRCTRLFEHLHQSPLSVTTNNGVINNNETLAGNHFTKRV